MENLYEILQVSKNASKEVIEKSYKTLAKKYHPDIAKNKEKAEEIMKKINNAYEILGDEFKRKEYDAQLYSENNNTNHQTNNNNYYQPNNNVNTNDAYQSNNMYHNNYDNYYDYMNNPDIFNRLFRLDSASRKVLVIVIIIASILFIKVVFDIQKLFKVKPEDNVVEDTPINQTSSTPISNNLEEFVIDNDLKYVFVDFMNDMQQFNIEKLNSYLSKDYKLEDNELYSIESNQKFIKNIMNDMQIKILNSTSSNLGNGKIDIEVTRVDFDLVLLEVSKEIYLNYNVNYTTEMINNMIIENIIKNKDNKANRKMTINFAKEDSKWKLKIGNSIFYDIFGFNITEMF